MVRSRLWLLCYCLLFKIIHKIPSVFLVFISVIINSSHGFEIKIPSLFRAVTQVTWYYFYSLIRRQVKLEMNPHVLIFEMSFLKKGSSVEKNTLCTCYVAETNL